MPPIPPHSTATTDRPWDGPAAIARAAPDAAVLRYMHAWRDPSMDPDIKAAYAMPHHAGQDAPANLPAVRNALARLSQSRIPQSHWDGVRQHLNRHLEDGRGD